MITVLLVILAGVIGLNVGFFFGAIFGGAAATRQLLEPEEEDPWADIQREQAPWQ